MIGIQDIRLNRYFRHIGDWVKFLRFLVSLIGSSYFIWTSSNGTIESFLIGFTWSGWTFNKKFIAVFRWSIIMFPNHNRKRTGKKQERSNNGLMKISKIKWHVQYVWLIFVLDSLAQCESTLFWQVSFEKIKSFANRIYVKDWEGSLEPFTKTIFTTEELLSSALSRWNLKIYVLTSKWGKNDSQNTIYLMVSKVT